MKIIFMKIIIWFIVFFFYCPMAVATKNAVTKVKSVKKKKIKVVPIPKSYLRLYMTCKH